MYKTLVCTTIKKFKPTVAALKSLTGLPIISQSDSYLVGREVQNNNDDLNPHYSSQGNENINQHDIDYSDFQFVSDTSFSTKESSHFCSANNTQCFIVNPNNFMMSSLQQQITQLPQQISQQISLLNSILPRNFKFSTSSIAHSSTNSIATIANFSTNSIATIANFSTNSIATIIQSKQSQISQQIQSQQSQFSQQIQSQQSQFSQQIQSQQSQFPQQIQSQQSQFPQQIQSQHSQQSQISQQIQQNSNQISQKLTMIIIRICTLNGQIIPIKNVPIIAKISVIKFHIKSKTRIPSNQQRLIYSGILLKDNLTLSDHYFGQSNNHCIII
ncbi:unnamed protein product [Rhizophagus irregularis]|nr:unnamed protein product [Rhizophagus irregularis]